MTNSERICKRCQATYEPDHNYCRICGLKIHSGQKAAAATTATIEEIKKALPKPMDKKRMMRGVKSTIPISHDE